MKIQSQRYLQDLRRYYRMPVMQTSMTLVLSLFVMALFIVFALRPTLVSIVTLKKTITESKDTLKKLDIKVDNLQKAATQLDSIKPFLTTLNYNIPNDGAKYSPLTISIESLANQNGVKLDGETLGPTLLFSRILTPFNQSKNQTVVTLPFTVRVTGAYPNVSMFLTKLLSMERLLIIDSVTITKEVEAKTSMASVALNISGSAYYLADDVQLQKSLSLTKGAK